MVTTIQLSHETKLRLDKQKKKSGASYEEVIKDLLLDAERLTVREDMVRYGKEHAKDAKKEHDDWSSTHTWK